ncbi:MAG: polyamine aminopropyltransferase [Peptococcia bacterium]
MKKNVWITEDNGNLAISYRVKETIHEEQTDFQHLTVVDTYDFGRMLFLDGFVMTSIKDEFVYHEMITQPAVNTHQNPEKVLIIGGGDGGAVRELVKHPKVKQITLVEIDGRVIENSKKYLPEIAASYDDPKVTVLVDDGIKHIKENKNFYDIIIIDSTDPIGPAEGLFSGEFYRNVSEALKEDGIMVAQTESPFADDKLIKRIHQDLQGIYPLVKLYLAYIPTYPTGMWTFTMASKKYDPLKVKAEDIPELQHRYYNKDIHFASFVLPNFVADIVK